MGKKGFALLEIIIVVAIISGLATISIPSLLRARMSANESMAQASLKTIVSAQVSYRISHGDYANLGQLDDDNPPYIDSNLATGTRSGYNFSCAGAANSFVAAAVPVSVNSGANRFCVTEDGVVRTDPNISNATDHDTCIGYPMVNS